MYKLFNYFLEKYCDTFYDTFYDEFIEILRPHIDKFNVSGQAHDYANNEVIKKSFQALKIKSKL